MIKKISNINEYLDRKSISFLFEEAEKSSSSFATAAKGFSNLSAVLAKNGMPDTASLVKNGNAKLSKILLDAKASDTNAVTMYYLAAQFGASLIRLFTGMNDVVEASDSEDDKKLSDVFGNDMKKTIAKFFFPSSGFLSKADKIIEKYKELESAGKSGGGKEIDEGLLDAIKGAWKKIFSSGPPKDSKTTVDNLKTLFGGNIAATLLSDLTSEEMTVGSFKEMLKNIQEPVKQLDFKAPQQQKQPQKNDEKGSEGGEKGSEGGEKGSEGGEKGSEGGEKPQQGKQLNPQAAKKKAIKVKDALAKFEEISSKPAKKRSKEEKEELLKITSMLDSIKAESSNSLHGKEILVERWQVLAGIKSK